MTLQEFTTKYGTQTPGLLLEAAAQAAAKDGNLKLAEGLRELADDLGSVLDPIGFEI